MSDMLDALTDRATMSSEEMRAQAKLELSVDRDAYALLLNELAMLKDKVKALERQVRGLKSAVYPMR